MTNSSLWETHEFSLSVLESHRLKTKRNNLISIHFSSLLFLQDSISNFILFKDSSIFISKRKCHRFTPRALGLNTKTISWRESARTFYRRVPERVLSMDLIHLTPTWPTLGEHLWAASWGLSSREAPGSYLAAGERAICSNQSSFTSPSARRHYKEMSSASSC